jgi:hypothetical protein
VPATLYVVDGTFDYNNPQAWVSPDANGLSANWITPYAASPGNTLATNDPRANTAPATYTFSLSGFAKPTNDLLINWASDNGATFALNGIVLSTISAPSENDQPFASLTLFTIAALSDLWLAENNVFTVTVTNLAYAGANPTGLLVNITETPLPPAALLFGTALLGLNWLSRRRKNSASILARASDG